MDVRSSILHYGSPEKGISEDATVRPYLSSNQKMTDRQDDGRTIGDYTIHHLLETTRS